jgi:dienelactone hydrolase
VDVQLTRTDGVMLSASYIPSRNGAAVIAFPGREGPQKHARMLARHGFGVLLFDQTGDGASQGDPNGFGWDGENDVRAAIAFLRRRPDVTDGRIGGIGLSVGGELLLQTAAHTATLRAVVSEGAGSRSVGEELERPGADKWLSSYPISAMVTAGTALFSDSLPPAHLIDLMPRIAPRPVLLVYTTHGVDTEDLNPRYFRAAGEPKSIWVIPEASHTGGIDARPREYERRVVGFFQRALL